MSATRRSLTLVRRLVSVSQQPITNNGHPTNATLSVCHGVPFRDIGSTATSSPYHHSLRRFSSNAGNTAETATGAIPEEEQNTSVVEEEQPAAAAAEVVLTREEELEIQIKELKDQLKYGLAEQQNIRFQAQRDVDSARQFAVSSFAKSLLETSDNLERAMEAVPLDMRNDKEKHPDLSTLFEGIKMTEDILLKAFEKNGLKKFGIKGEKFDPNKHNALFVYPDAQALPGSVGQVLKSGYMLHGRVIRPADVGVVEKK